MESDEDVLKLEYDFWGKLLFATLGAVITIVLGTKELFAFNIVYIVSITLLGILAFFFIKAFSSLRAHYRK